MASATATPSPTSAPTDVSAPAPLEFFKQDYIDSDNRELLEREQQRWRLLGRWERIRLRFYVGSLGRQLQRARYNQKIAELHKLRIAFRRAKLRYQQAASDDEKQIARERAEAIIARARPRIKALQELRPTYELYQHYAGWLEYERKHRRELKEEARREERITREMNREAGWLESLLVDVFRKTGGCHYTYTPKGSDNPITRTPKFERSVTTPDAHYFYLAASRRTLFGWRWLLPYNVSISRLTEEEVVANMHAATKRQVTPVWSESGQLIFRVSRLDSPDALPKEVKWRDAMKFFPEARRWKLPYCIGVNEGRKFQWFDLVSDPHILVAGKSQSGKSNLVNGMIASLASTHSPDELRIVLVDQKGGIEFTHWYDLPHLLWDIVKTVDEVQPVLERLVSIMRKRMALLEKSKAKDIASYNKRVDIEYRLARVLVVIDEMNTFVGLKGLTEDIHNLIMLLVSQGRAVGLHVIAATQHPEVKVIPGRIKTNMSMRLSGAMPTVTASMIVLDSPEAARIPNVPGRFVAVVGLTTLTVQVPHILDDDIAGVVSATRKEYPDVAENLSDAQEQPEIVVWDEQRVLRAALDWLEGQLSADKLHKTLGSESPGERHLRRVCRRLVDQAKAERVLTLDKDGSQWTLTQRGKAYYLVAYSGDTGDTDAADVADSKDLPSVSASASLPAIEVGAGAAAD